MPLHALEVARTRAPRNPSPERRNSPHEKNYIRTSQNSKKEQDLTRALGIPNGNTDTRGNVQISVSLHGEEKN